MNLKRDHAHLDESIKEVLRFDSFYFRRLAEATDAARVNEVNSVELGIFRELLHGPCPLRWLVHRLNLDPGYLSRSLKRLELLGFISSCAAAHDRRMRQVELTDWGNTVARDLERFHEEAVRNTLQALPLRQQRRLVRAMRTIIDVLERDALANFLECHAPQNKRPAG